MWVRKGGYLLFIYRSLNERWEKTVECQPFGFGTGSQSKTACAFGRSGRIVPFSAVGKMSMEKGLEHLED